MYCQVYEKNTLCELRYVVVFSRYAGRWMLSRHRQRTTWETQGGHIEAGETPAEAAVRELYEESGVTDADIRYLFDYRAGDDNGYGDGAVFLADVHRLGTLPDSEMAEVRLFDTLPPAQMLTYPGITPVLWDAFCARPTS